MWNTQYIYHSSLVWPFQPHLLDFSSLDPPLSPQFPPLVLLRWSSSGPWLGRAVPWLEGSTVLVPILAASSVGFDGAARSREGEPGPGSVLSPTLPTPFHQPLRKHRLPGPSWRRVAPDTPPHTLCSSVLLCFWASPKETLALCPVSLGRSGALLGRDHVSSFRPVPTCPHLGYISCFNLGPPIMGVFPLRCSRGEAALFRLLPCPSHNRGAQRVVPLQTRALCRRE